MILYHGSNVIVREPPLLKIRRDLDFGKGFYTTSDFQQASKWARRTANRLKQSQAYVSVYEVPEEKLLALRVLRFDKPDQQWLHFVAANRKGAALSHSDSLSNPGLSQKPLQQKKKVTGDPRNSAYLRSEI